MTYLKTLTRVAGVGLCVVAFSGTALADPGNGNGTPPATPPGQEKKAETPAAAAPAPAPAPQAAQGQEQKAENQAKQAQKKAAPKPAAKSQAAKSQAAKAAAPGQAKKAEKQAAKAAKQASKPATPSEGQSANAQRHVIVCHRTGSLSNPYVVINIPYTAWTNGHTTHPAKNGNSDKLLKDPASRPGSKDGFDKSACGGAAAPATTALVTPKTEQKTETAGCPAATTTTEQVLVGVWHATGAYKNGERKFVYITPSLNSAHYDRSKHADDKPVYGTRTVTRTASGESCATVTSTPTTTDTQSSNVTQSSNEVVSTSAANVQSASAGAQAPAGGVAGAVSPANASKAQKKAEQPGGGVLGAIASAPEAVAQTATSGTLPFTGIPLWIAALIGSALLATGLVLRRTS